MIQISLKGLAKFMTTTAAGQRKILRDFKYPDEEGQAQAAYYRDARNAIAKFHDQKLPSSWLGNQADSLLANASTAPKPQISARLKNNARGLRSYACCFAATTYDILSDVNLGLCIGEVLVTVNPDLHVLEKGKEKLLKLEFSSQKPHSDLIKIVSQAMFEAALADGMRLPSAQVLYIDVPRGIRHKGARFGALTRKNIEAACQNIWAIWNSI